jgi:hypothetical protein
MFSRAYRAAITVPPLVWVADVSARPLSADVLLQLLVRLTNPEPSSIPGISITTTSS